MTNNTQPLGSAIGITREMLKHVDHETTPVITKSLGNVERCVSGYSKLNHKGFFGFYAGVIYRIWNAIKSIFGQSDWQKARRSLKNIMIKVGNHPLIVNLPKERQPMVGDGDMSKPLLTEVLPQIGEKISKKDLDKVIENLIVMNDYIGFRELLSIPQFQTVIGNKDKAAMVATGILNELKNIIDVPNFEGEENADYMRLAYLVNIIHNIKGLEEFKELRISTIEKPLLLSPLLLTIKKIKEIFKNINFEKYYS